MKEIKHHLWLSHQACILLYAKRISVCKTITSLNYEASSNTSSEPIEWHLCSRLWKNKGAKHTKETTNHDNATRNTQHSKNDANTNHTRLRSHPVVPDLAYSYYSSRGLQLSSQ